MAFVNLPPNFQDMFYSITDRIAKLETGPNQAMYTAEAAQGSAQSATAIALNAQSVAEQAEIDAINAGIQANNAAAQATLASSQATQAQLSANGKNTIFYGTLSTPGTGNISNASANGTTITYTVYNGVEIGQSVTISGIANNTASITGATGNGTTITYTSGNNYAVGQTVTVTGINPSRWDATGVITARTSGSFSIAGSTTGLPAYISGGTSSAPSLLNTTGTVTSQSFTQFSIASTRLGTYTSGGSLNTNGLTFQVGDIYFQYNTSSQVIAQSTWNGSSWQSTPITNAVITNIDAGKITTGIITSIEYNNGSGTFLVTPAGALTASSATITGTVRATTGYFGTGTGSTLTNGWSIGATGLTGVGTATITGGLIQGSAITVPNSSAWKFAVDSAGSLQAVNANITGAITATSGSFTGTITSTSGTIGGFTLSASSIFSGTNLVIESTGNISGGNSQTLFYGYVNIGGGTAGSERLIVTGNSNFNGNIISTTDITCQNNYYYPFPDVVTGTANIRRLSGSTPAGRLVDNGASSQRYKHDIVNLMDVSELDPRRLYELPVRAFRYNLDYLSAYDDRYDVLIPGFIAEEVDQVYPLAADYEETIGIHTWNERMIIPGMLALIQDQNARLKVLEGN